MTEVDRYLNHLVHLNEKLEELKKLGHTLSKKEIAELKKAAAADLEAEKPEKDLLGKILEFAGTYLPKILPLVVEAVVAAI